ncbi:hypothetical protein A2U01_0088247, partial [Trifolium medium]|nr:hypothetical protein [Trifolium medium]
PEEPPVVSTIPPGAPMETIMATLVNAINRQGDLIREQNQRFEAQSQRLAVFEESRATRYARSYPQLRKEAGALRGQGHLGEEM